jgi:oligo-alginate lyase
MPVNRREFLTASLGVTLAAATLWSEEAAAMATTDERTTAGEAEQDTPSWPPPGFGAKEIPPRKPQFSLKSSRTLLSDAEIARAQNNLRHYIGAAKLAANIYKEADRWLEWDDAELALLCTPARIPRDFDVGASIGCPKCGKAIHEKFGTYPWLVDLKKPFKLTCPVDGTIYPDNDYEAYYRSGFREKPGWDKPVVDDGWGWLNPANGERYWFVAHYNHRVWHYHISPGVAALGQAYLLTGDRRYAHKAAVFLYHIATVYPPMDHEKQSRYGALLALQGRRYPGKVLNLIWETSLARQFAEAYDAVWETLDSDTALQKAVGRIGPEIRAHIEANLLEDAIDAYFSKKIAGNFGMHQSALANLAIVRQHEDSDAWLGGLMTHTTTDNQHIGIDYALYNLVYRDGYPSESAPGYNFLWTSQLTTLSALLAKGGKGYFQHPKMKRLYDAVLDQIVCGKFTPAIGDSGSVYGEMAGRSPETYQIAYAAYKDPRYATFLAYLGAVGEGAFPTFASLFREPLTDATGNDAKPRDAMPPQRARVRDGYGLAVLSGPTDTTALSLYYGLRAGHGHFDRLGIELFGAEQPLLPDNGYPDAMNDFVSGIYSWSKNTISHNTVVVDAGRQAGNVPGTIRFFADGAKARVVDVDAAGTYPQATTYRRALLMVDVGDRGDAYYLDIFDVAGGKQHDYSLHGPPGEFAFDGDASGWSGPEPGTLAGKDVPLGTLYDDPVRGKPGYKGGYSTYVGSGFQHLFNVRRCQDDKRAGIPEWRHEKDAAARLRVHLLPQPGQERILAQAHVSPVKYPQIVHYLIARRTGTDLTSRFVSLLEPFREMPLLRDATIVSLAEGKGTAVRVSHQDGRTDILLYDSGGTGKRLAAPGLPEIITDARAAVVTLGANGGVERIFAADGNALTVAGKKHEIAPAPAGTVIGVEPARGRVQVRVERGKPSHNLLARFANDRGRHAAHPVTVVQNSSGGEWTLDLGDDLRIGRAHVTKREDDGRRLVNDLSFPLAPTYTGCALTGPDFAAIYPVARVEASIIHLVDPLPADALPANGDAYLISVGSGDRFEMPSVYEFVSGQKTPSEGK